MAWSGSNRHPAWIEWECTICKKRIKNCGFGRESHRRYHLRKGDIKDMRVGIYENDFRNDNEYNYSRELFGKKLRLEMGK